MPIEANIEVIQSDATNAIRAAKEFERVINRIIRVRAELEKLGQPMTGAQKQAALAAGNTALDEFDAAHTAVHDAWDSATEIDTANPRIPSRTPPERP